jgi:hypothetical protein
MINKIHPVANRFGGITPDPWSFPPTFPLCTALDAATYEERGC